MRVDDLSCRILVNMPAIKPPTQAKYFNIWAGGIAMNTMCIQHGYTGIVEQLGKHALILAERATYESDKCVRSSFLVSKAHLYSQVTMRKYPLASHPDPRRST